MNNKSLSDHLVLEALIMWSVVLQNNKEWAWKFYSGESRCKSIKNNRSGIIEKCCGQFKLDSSDYCKSMSTALWELSFIWCAGHAPSIHRVLPAVIIKTWSLQDLMVDRVNPHSLWSPPTFSFFFFYHCPFSLRCFINILPHIWKSPSYSGLFHNHPLSRSFLFLCFLACSLVWQESAVNRGEQRREVREPQVHNGKQHGAHGT